LFKPSPDSSLVGLLSIPRRIFLGQNVRELRRVKYLAAQLALDKLDVFLASDDADLRMFA
jgi:hypothetical protein